jgi:hypothetical protein
MCILSQSTRDFIVLYSYILLKTELPYVMFVMVKVILVDIVMAFGRVDVLCYPTFLGTFVDEQFATNQQLLYNILTHGVMWYFNMFS